MDYLGADLLTSPQTGVPDPYKCQILCQERNETLQKALHEESERLFEHSKAVKDSKSIGGGERIPLWVNCVVDLFRKFF